MWSVCCVVMGGHVCGCGALAVWMLMHWYILRFIVALLVLMLLWGGNLLHCGHKERKNQMPALSNQVNNSLCLCGSLLYWSSSRSYLHSCILFFFFHLLLMSVSPLSFCSPLYSSTEHHRFDFFLDILIFKTVYIPNIQSSPSLSPLALAHYTLFFLIIGSTGLCFNSFTKLISGTFYVFSI